MKKIIFGLLVVCSGIAACKKDTVTSPADTVKYMSFTANSSWNYALTDNLTAVTTNYTITSTDRDSTINSKAYHVFTNSGGANQYYFLSGSDYYNFQNLPATLSGNLFENIYLKDNAAAGTSWSQNYSVTTSGVPLTITIVNTIAEKGISKTVNNIAYTDVTHVMSTIAVSAFGIPLPASAITSDVQSFYAKKYGLIQSVNKININYSGIVSNTDQQTILKSADIK
ncbi:MAG: hypothetical protein JWR61_3070 [Ferruginibacter sp.]|uniref:hypothetical protein n=1 Tax=Ferruginibacter sp. TaxID=1940288 RepID=UPI00265B6DB2|nr:hypothetical protein [Ferruginibacter sp.]MDB5278115.1 hypothetical protein [Ferruginibacter sp.]